MDIEKIYADLKTFYNINSRLHNLINPRYEKTYNSLSWENHLSNEKFDEYDEYYQWVVDKIQYSFMMSDESAIQIYFEGENVRGKYLVVKGAMAYLPRPDKYSEYFRFDIDYNNAKNYSHAAYHIHFGYRAKDVRFSLFQFPMPSEFIKLVLFLDYGLQCVDFKADKFFKDLTVINNPFNHSLRFVLDS